MGANPWGTDGRESGEFLKLLQANFTHFLVVFHTFSPMYAYVFFRACRHHSTKSAKWGHLIPFDPLSAIGGGGNCPLCRL